MRQAARCFVLVLLVTATHQLAQLCSIGSFFNVQHCEACAPNCICSQMGGCSRCASGYTMFQGSCIQCPIQSGIYGACSECCSHSTGTQLSCTNCQPVAGFYSFLFSGRCILSPGCFEVDANGFCQLCKDGYYQQNNLCQRCNPSCATCLDTTACLTCNSGFLFINSNGGLCTACATGCATCTDTTVCTSCLVGYYLGQTSCFLCSTDCGTCLDESTCTNCLAGILVSNLCIRCTDTVFGGSIGCLTCIKSRSFITCQTCDDQYFLDSSTGACKLCSGTIPGAMRCLDKDTPTQCLNDYDPTLSNRYYLVGMSCIKNTKNCRIIADINGNCALCYSQYALTAISQCALCSISGCDSLSISAVGSSCICSKCNPGYYLNAVTSTCIACGTLNCAVCPAGGACTSCVSGFYLNGATCSVSTALYCLTASSGSTCSQCNPGYFRGSNGNCYLCQTNCLSCSSKFVCTSCAAGWKLIGSECVAPPLGCASLSPEMNCTLCQYGFHMSNGTCLECSIEKGTLAQCRGLCPIDDYLEYLLKLEISLLNWVDSMAFRGWVLLLVAALTVV